MSRQPPRADSAPQTTPQPSDPKAVSLTQTAKRAQVEMPRLLTLSEAARVLRVHRNTLDRQRRAGRLGWLSIGRRVLVPAEALRGRGSYEAARNALRAWVEFCTLHDVVFVHEMKLAVQEQFVAWRRHTHPRGIPLSNGTINRGLDVLRAALHDAWRRGQLTAFPHIRLIPKPPPRDLFLTREEVQRLLAACTEPHLYRFVMLAAHTLQRPSAILNLRVQQVDLTWNRIDFLPSGNVQSNKRRPIVPITPTLRPVLEEAIRESQSGYVIEYDGRPVLKVKRAFQTAARRAGLPHATPGILRHTGATLLAAAGVPLREISGMLGHTTSRITEEVYAKRRPEFLAEAACTLDQLFTAATSSTDTILR